ncbi:MAG: type II toxin-antitoxin system VapC family toxin [Streptosporangiaceae bacterium]
MIIDSSAILSVIGQEPGYERIVHELAASPVTRIGAPTRLETGIVLTARFGPRGKTALARFLQENSIETVAFDEAHASAALDAYSRFGKGRLPAALNFGDCCTYAIASVAGEPLLCIGDDFVRTDLLLVSLDNDEKSADAGSSVACAVTRPSLRSTVALSLPAAPTLTHRGIRAAGPSTSASTCTASVLRWRWSPGTGQCS